VSLLLAVFSSKKSTLAPPALRHPQSVQPLPPGEPALPPGRRRVPFDSTWRFSFPGVEELSFLKDPTKLPLWGPTFLIIPLPFLIEELLLINFPEI